MSEQITFLKNSDSKKGMHVTVLSKEHIGQGIYGIIFKTKVAIDHVKGAHSFVIKEFVVGGAENALNIYNQVKKLGLPTWSTYRISEEKDRMLITLGGNRENNYLVSPGPYSKNRYSLDEKILTEKRLKEIDNFEDIICQLIDKIIAAGDVIYIPGDSYFFNYRSIDKKLKILVGDMDSIMDTSTNPPDHLTVQNLEIFIDIIEVFIDNYIHEEHKVSFMDRLANIKIDKNIL